MKTLQESFQSIINGFNFIFSPKITYDKTIEMPYEDSSFKKLIKQREEIKNDK